MRKCVIIALISLFALIDANSKIIYVREYIGHNISDGLTWQTAYIDLQEAIDSAVAGDQIWVAQGTYYPSKMIGGTNYSDKAFQMKKGVAIYGGFWGNEDVTELYQRNISANITTLSAGTADMEGYWTGSDRLFYHTADLDLDSTALLNGFSLYNTVKGAHDTTGVIMTNIGCAPKIANCSTRSAFIPNDSLNQIYNINAKLIIENCKFDWDVNAIYVVNSELIIDSCDFSNMFLNLIKSNNSKIICRNSNFYFEELLLDEFRFERELCAFNIRQGSVLIDNCTFRGLFSSNKALLDCSYLDTLIISNSKFTVYNYENYNGFLKSNSTKYTKLNNCEFEHCTSGGVSTLLFDSNAQVDIVDTYFSNFSNGSYTSSLITNQNSKILNFENCVFLNIRNFNHIISGNCNITNCSFTKNNSNNTNSILVGTNIKAYNTLFFDNNITTTIKADTVELYNCLIKDDTVNIKAGLSTIQNCIYAEPAFVLDTVNPLLISRLSPCIDAGNSTFSTTTKDIRGSARKLNRDGSYNGTVDIGAYEYNAQNDSILTPLIIYVKADATGNNDGTSWANSFNSLQSALDIAIDGSQIWVAQGTYYPSKMIEGTSDRDKAFQMKKGVAIYGGFGGFEIDMYQRNLNTYNSILSGDIGTIGEINDNCYHVINNNSEMAPDNNSILDGFEIRYASASAIKNNRASIVLKYIKFRNNEGANGTAIYSFKDTLNIQYCDFSDNLNYAIANDSNKVTIGFCNFERKDLSEDFRVMAMINSASSVNISNCSFNRLNNIGYSGSLANSYSNMYITNSVFISNKLIRDVQNVQPYCASVINNNHSTAFVYKCKFDSNYSAFGSGVIYDIISSSTYRSCSFASNRTDSSGGVIAILNNSDVSIINSEFFNNSAQVKGGAIYSYSNTNTYLSHLNIVNCTIADNQAGQSGALHFESKYGTSKYRIDNSIIRNNESTYQPLEIYITNPADTLYLNNSCISNSKSDIYGRYVQNKCINSDPMFALRGDFPYSITKESPCVDAGNSANYINKLYNYDIRGTNYPRFLDINGDSAYDKIDIGAYEYKNGVDPISSNLIIYVNVNASGSNNGKTWADAYINMQDAIDYAISNDQIWVAKGIYYPTMKIAGENERYRAFKMKDGVKIYGGFLGNETELSQASPDINICVLSGNIGIDTLETDNCYHVFNHSQILSLNNNAELNGFTISDGYCLNEFNNAMGAGMYNVGNSPKIVNCYFRNNTAGEGGAISNTNSFPHIINTRFSNFANNGADISNFNNSTATIEKCTFNSSVANTNGGSFYIVNSMVLIDSCIFHKVSAGTGAVFHAIENSQLTVRNSQFDSCSATLNGGVFYNYSTLLNVFNSTFKNCTAQYGSVIFNLTKFAYFYNSLIASNSSLNGTAYNGDHGNLSFVNTTITNNNAENYAGVFNTLGDVTAINSIIWGNIANSDGSQIMNQTGNFALLGSCYPLGTDNVSGTVEPTYCVNEDPQFVKSGNWIYNLCGTSPCIDAGYSDYLSEVFDVRGVGYPRNLDKNTAAEGRIDIGAFEYKLGSDPLSGIDYSAKCFALEVLPNPILDNAELRFYLDYDMNIELFVSDLLGNNILYLLSNTQLGAGSHNFKLDVSALSSGTYFAIIKSGSIGSRIKFVVQK